MKSLPADNIYQRLCDLRNGTGKSQKEVADELNIQASVLSRIERGETKSVSHDLVIKFAEYYNVSTDYFPDLTGGLSLKTVKTADFEKISDVADDVKETSPVLTKKQYNFQTATYDAEMKVTTDNKGKTTESTESKNVKSSIRKLLEKFHRDKK